MIHVLAEVGKSIKNAVVDKERRFIVRPYFIWDTGPVLTKNPSLIIEGGFFAFVHNC